MTKHAERQSGDRDLSDELPTDRADVLFDPQATVEFKANLTGVQVKIKDSSIAVNQLACAMTLLILTTGFGGAAFAIGAGTVGALICAGVGLGFGYWIVKQTVKQRAAVKKKTRHRSR